MIHHVQSNLLTEIGQRAMTQSNNTPADKASVENFRRALTAAHEASGGGTAKAGSVELQGAHPLEGANPVLTASFTPPTSSLPIPPTSNTAPANAVAPATVSAPAPDAQQAFDDAYWAQQPPAVQALRDVQDPSERSSMAAQLASEGYKIDVPIMVWGWDPSIVTSMRQAEGYTWVPSALQTPVEMLPGLPSMGTMAAYNPNNPPAGSITV